MQSAFIVILVALAAIPPGVADAQGRGRGRGNNNAAIRFVEMDRNNDRTITRAEWTGSDRSFVVHDWNGDGRLSGDEVRVGARRPPRDTDDRTFDSPEREYPFDDWTARGFTAVDDNRDGRVTRDEWHFDRESFRRADHNGDGIISRAEFLNEGPEDDDREDRFDDLDLNRDNRVSRNEWHGTAARFMALDANSDGVLTRVEVTGPDAPTSAAFKAGQARGLIEGRDAGREDKQLRNQWDLEGQRELEQADSGYDANVGPRSEYQAGYREAFRRGYREGFGQR